LGDDGLLLDSRFLAHDTYLFQKNLPMAQYRVTAGFEAYALHRATVAVFSIPQPRPDYKGRGAVFLQLFYRLGRKIDLAVLRRPVDQGGQVLQRGIFADRAEVAVEFQHRGLAVKVTAEIRHVGLAGDGSLGAVVHGGAAADAGGGGPPAVLQPDAGQVDAGAGLQRVGRVVLVHRGRAQAAAADALAVGHLPVDGIGRAQHGVGVVQPAFFQRRPDAGGGDRLRAVLGHGYDMHLNARPAAQRVQEFHIA